MGLQNDSLAKESPDMRVLHPPWNFHYVLGGPEAPTNPIFVETSDLRGSTGPFSREVIFFLFSGFFCQPTL